jgi:hypothetical protein
MYRPEEVLKLLVVCADSSKDSQDQKEDCQVYEREYVEHGNCKCCTSFAESAKSYELWLKQRRKRKGSAMVSIAAERDFFDPITEYRNKENGN